MQLMLLPGNSARNKPWIHEVEKNLKALFKSTYLQEYEHWKSESSFINMPIELQRLVEHIKRIDEKYIIFSKSIGIIVTLQGLIQKRIHPEVCIFVGNPSHWESRLGITSKDVKKNITLPILFIQQENDPLMSYKQVKNMVQELEVPNPTLQKVPGNNHHYDNVHLLKEIIQEFVSKEID